MNWLERNYPWVMLALAVVLAPVIVGFPALSGVALLAGALGGASAGALLTDAALVVGVTVLLVVTELALLVSFATSLYSRLSFPTSERLSTLFGGLETVFPPLRNLALSRRFEPSLEERKAATKRRYVDGDLSEAAFEREMRDLLADADRDSLDHADPLDDLDVSVEDRDRTDDRTVRDLLRSK